MVKKVKDYFEEIATDFDSYYEKPKGLTNQIINAWLRRPGLLKRLQIALQMSNPQPSIKILDIGCGSGKFVVECAKRGAEAHGIDVSEEMIALAKKFSEKNKVQTHLRTGDATKSLPEGFNVCVALGVIEYFEDPRIILNNMVSSVTDSGKIIFSVHSKFALQTPLRKLLMAKRKVKCYYHTKKTVRALVNGLREPMGTIDILSYGPGLVVCVEREKSAKDSAYNQ